MRPRRALLLLWAGAAIGLVLALTSLAFPARGRSSGALSPGVVATVNGQPISRGDYDAVLRTIGELRQRAVTDEDRRAALDRLIDDELLIEYGLQLGMARGDPTTRQALLGAVFTAERARNMYQDRAADEAMAAKVAELRKAAQIQVVAALP